MTSYALDIRILKNLDWPLIGAMLALCLTGLVLLYSAGYNPDTKTSPQVMRQLISLSIGFVAFSICISISPAFWKRWAFVFYALGCVLLVAVLFGGNVAGGAKRWLELGGFRFQPSEFMKVALILAFAKVLSSESAPEQGYDFKSLIVPAAVVSLPVVLILVEPDLGTALCHVLIAGSMLLLADVKKSVLLKLSGLGVLLAIPAWFGLREYQKARIVSFLSPENDPLGSGYHAIQSKIAVGSGSIFGKGFMEGTQTQLSFLPEQTTDFIFSVLAEEWGFIGTASVLAIYAFIILYCLALSSKCHDKFSAYVVCGVSFLIFWHMLVNIGMVIGVLPVVGLTLPLISYGGSSAISIMAAFGLVVGVGMRRSLFS